MSQSTYQSINLTANLTLLWPASFGSGTYVQDINDVNAAAGPFSIIMPDATEATKGFYALFNNVSANSFNIMANDGTTLITAVDAGKLIEIYLYDNSTANGLWRTPAFASGTNAITTLTATSTDNSILITNPTITPPGGSINFALPQSLYNFNNISDVGFASITDTAPLTFASVSILGSENITVDNGDGVDGSPTVTLKDELVGITSLTVGGIILTSTTIASANANIDLVISTSGTGDLDLNGTLIDTIGSVAVAGNLTVSGTFSNALMPKVSVVFNDTIVGTTNYINIISKSNNAATLTWISAGNYKLTFGITLANDNYGAEITCGTNGGSLPFVAIGSYITSTMTTTEVDIQITDLSGIPVTSLPYGATIEIIQS